MVIKGAPHSPKPQHYWNLTIILFSVISRTLDRGRSYRSAEVQSVDSTDSADWESGYTWCIQFLYRHLELSKTLENSLLLLYILWDDWPIFMISTSNEQLQQQLEYTLLKPDCHSWWISKMQCGREDALEERYAIKFCFKLGKMMPQKRMKCFSLLLEHLAWIEHQFLSGIRDSRKAGSL